MSRLQVDTVGDQTEFEPGAEIDVYLEWELDTSPDVIELRTVWNTSGKGDTDVGVVATQRFDLPSPQESRQTTITLPIGPYSFSGKLISLMWGLELVALPGCESTRREITIAPGGREVAIMARSLDATE